VFETYGMLKRLAESLPQGPLRVVINHAFSEADGKEAYVRFKDLIESRFGVSLKLAGVLPVEKEMLLLERSGRILAIERPNHPFAVLLKQIAEELDFLKPDHKKVAAQG
jgi:MinD-like ATPase involved in chromosome partitioning or flagellar assembly